MSAPDDLTVTVRELSNTYEELSLLYRLSGVFSLLSVDDICDQIVQEAMSAIGVQTAAVLFLDAEGVKLSTKNFRGDWNAVREFVKDEGVLWKTIASRKPAAFCKLAETEHHSSFPQLKSLMVCPLVGKKKLIGILLVADKVAEEEFYSHDLKLLNAITAQAGLAIENAFLYGELEALLIGAIRSLVKALEATSFWTAGHTERVTEYAVGIGGHIGLEREMLERLKICALLHDIGKIGTPKEILNKKGSLGVEEWKEIRRHPELGADILVELTQFKDVVMGVKYHHEYWDGSGGIYGLRGEDIPLMARILSVADAFDAMTSDRPYKQMKSREGAVEEIVRCSGAQFDPKVVSAFLEWVKGFTPQRQTS
jgi:putative nucleotidyltransferase with HDIG domain